MTTRKLSKTDELADTWKQTLIGQDHAVDKIVPYMVRAMAGLSTPGKPIGVFFLMGPSGTGKTRTAETLAEVLHGHEKHVLRIDCGEYQMDHEIAKLIGAPPGYLGHRETHPLLAQARISAVASEKSPFSIILFDEIEKASGSMWRILLGVLEKATLKMGDNSVTDFQQTVIFMSSNLGAKEMAEMFAGGYGFGKLNSVETSKTNTNAIEKIGLGALSRRFPPEFPNRIDEIISYRPLTLDNMHKITSLELNKVQAMINTSLGDKTFNMHFNESIVHHITKAGTSTQYGARELKRVVNRSLLNPLADDVIACKIRPGAEVRFKIVNGKIEWEIENRGPFEDDDAYEFEMPLIQPIPVVEQPSPKRSTRTKRSS